MDVSNEQFAPLLRRSPAMQQPSRKAGQMDALLPFSWPLIHARRALMSELPRLHLHFGFHKTGTTSLQHMLRLNLGRLPADLLVLVNPSPLTRRLGDVCREFDRHPGPQAEQQVSAAWADIVETVLRSGRPRALLSTENILGRIPSPTGRRQQGLYPSAGHILRLLREQSAGVMLSPALYTREPATWLASLHGHLVNTRALSMRLERFSAQPVFAGLDLDVEAHRLAAEAGCDIEVYRFEDDLRTPLGMGTQLLRAIGLTEEELSELLVAPRRNERVPADLVAFATTRPVAWLPRPLRHAAMWAHRRGWSGTSKRP